MNKALISGRSYHQCLQYMRGRKVSDYAWRFVWERDSLRGLRGLTLVALEGTPEDVLDQARVQDFKVVKDYVPGSESAKSRSENTQK